MIDTGPMNHKTRYQTVLFDVGGTLIFPDPSVGHIYAKEAESFGIQLSVQEAQGSFFKAWAKVKNDWASRLHYGRNDGESRMFWKAIVYETFAPYSNGLDMDPLFQHLYTHFGRPNTWSLYSDVLKTLSQLKSMGYTLGILSNWDNRLPPILEGLGISDYFDHSFISFAVGIEKPDIAIFKHVLNRLSSSHESVLYIGNDYQDDYIPAQSLGINTLLIDRGDPVESEGPASSISSLDGVFQYLA